MEQLEMPIEDTRLSHSSANTLRGCSRKYFHYKVAKTDVDPDYNPNLQSFAVGKAFHQVLEDNMHKKPEKIVNVIEAACEVNGCDEENIPMLHAMLLRYYEDHKTSGLEVVKCEYKIDDETVIGYVDVVMKGREGSWRIVDLKTYKSLYYVKPANLTRDYQLNLYASFKDTIAKDLGLDPLKFQGCTLRVVTKPSLKQRKDESYVEYVTRMKASAKFLDIHIPSNLMSPLEVREAHEELYRETIEMRKWGKKGVCNFNNCFAYNTPCQFYSQCHDGTFSELSEHFE